VLMTFDERSARLSGVPVVAFEVAFNVLVALAVVASIKIVGALLVSALLIIPAASAMQFSRSFKGTMLSALVLGLLTVMTGMLVSFYFDLATGGAIVLVGLLVFTTCVGVRKLFKLGKKEMAPDTICAHGLQETRFETKEEAGQKEA
jgi:zinc transport system permease protein